VLYKVADYTKHRHCTEYSQKGVHMQIKR